jgi:hypothetical protein
VTRLVQNGGAATARVLFPLRPSLNGGHFENTQGVFQRRADLYGDLGVLGLGEGDRNQRGAVGLGAEMVLAWRVSRDEGGDDTAARVVLAFRGTSHFAFNGPVVTDVEQRFVNFGQALLAIEQNGVVSFGVAANTVHSDFRHYVPGFSFVLSAARR